MNPSQIKPLAVVTGASTGIGYELAKQFAQNGFDLVVVADEAQIEEAANDFRAHEGSPEVQALQIDLATVEGADKLHAALQGRPVAALAANAGRGLGHAFLDQDWAKIEAVIGTNVVGTLRLIYKVAADMKSRGEGRILITSSIASQIPGAFQAVYNASKAFLQSFSFALRNELKDTGVSVTALLPGATETEFFERGELMDTSVGQAKKDDAAKVAEDGFKGLMKGEGDVTSGWKNKLQVAAARVLPDTLLAEQHRGMAEPGSGKQ